MNTETALPVAAEQVAEASEQQTAEQLAAQTEATVDGEEAKEAEPAKKEKTAEEKLIARQQRRIDNLTKRLYQQQPPNEGLQQQPKQAQNAAQQADDEPVTLSRKELQAEIDKRARELAPTMKQQADEIEHRRGIVDKLAKDLGTEKFDALAAELEDALDGLKDDKGRPKPATDAIFESADPRALIEYLADPDNAEEAEALGRMSPVRAGMKVAEIGAKLAGKSKQPQRSSASQPLEPVRAGGSLNGAPDPSNVKAWVKWANREEHRAKN